MEYWPPCGGQFGGEMNMDAVAIASDEADARAAEAVERHHAQLAGALALKVESLTAVARANRPLGEEVRGDLVSWCRTELVPHALAEESTLYRAAAQRPEGRLLVEALLAEHQFILGLVEELDQASDPMTAAVTAHALRAVFETHLAKENHQVLPLLVGAPDVSVAELLGDLGELIGVDSDPGHGRTPARGEPAGHRCGCHEEEGTELPVLDARGIPHPIRHATIFGALDSVAPGRGLVLVAPHDPVPLLAQIEQRSPGEFVIEYLERGPGSWRLSMVRAVRVRCEA
jgi:uncharacterized protein (DUF2249 family)